jgi:hypothetical protein
MSDLTRVSEGYTEDLFDAVMIPKCFGLEFLIWGSSQF